jgi:hypothetical protein
MRYFILLFVCVSWVNLGLVSYLLFAPFLKALIVFFSWTQKPWFERNSGANIMTRFFVLTDGRRK